MKPASATNQDGILDEGFHHHPGMLSWSVFGDERLNPVEILERAEEVEEEAEEEPEGVRGEVLMVILDLILGEWHRMPVLESVADRVLGMAAALGYWGGKGLPLRGARKSVLEVAQMEEARRVLDYLFLNERRSKGSAGVNADQVAMNALAIALYVNHGALEGWSQAMLGRACGQTPAGMMERVKRLCNRPVEKSGGRARASWQQNDEQREGSAMAQKRFHDSRKPKNKTDK